MHLTLMCANPHTCAWFRCVSAAVDACSAARTSAVLPEDSRKEASCSRAAARSDTAASRANVIAASSPRMRAASPAAASLAASVAVQLVCMVLHMDFRKVNDERFSCLYTH